MFFNDLIERRLAALLQPWLRDDPELEFKLGFLRSNGTLHNVSFNTSALNELLEDPSRCCFKEVRAEHLSIKLSPWSSSAFTLAIRGLHFVVSLGEEEDERGVKRRPRVKDITMEDKNKVLAEIDPEGCTLHASLRRITDITTRTWGKSLLNTVFAHSQIQFHDVHVLFQSPNSHNAFSFSLYVKKIEAGSQNFGHRCFIRGFMGSLFVPSEDSSFDIDIDSFEIRLNGENHSNSVVPATNMSALVNVTNLQFTSVCLRVPRLNFIFSPADISVILLFYALLSKESKFIRPGRLLWNIVASRLSSLLPSTNLSLLKVVKFTCLWLQYVNTYKNLLLLVGYPVRDQMQRSAEVMSRDTTYSSSVKSKWELISNIENDLPLEAIAFARQIARFRLASRGPRKPDGFDELVGQRTFWKLPQLLGLILCVVGSLLCSIARFLLLYKVLAIFPKSHQKYATFQEDCLLGTGISLIVQQISISVSPNNSVKRSASGKAVTVTAVSYQDLLSFHILADAFFLRYAVNVSEQYLISATGCLKILSSPLVKAGASSKSKEPANKKLDEKQIIWGEPGQINYFPQATNVGGETSVPHLDHIIGRMWLNWKESYSKFEEFTPNVLTPWILCEVKSSLTHHGLNDFSSWFWNCGLTVGRLNFYLDYFSIATILVLLRQIQCSLSSSDKMRENVVLNTLDQDPSMRDLSSRCRSYSSKIKSDIIRILPQKHIQIGALIAGPHIQISLLNNKFYSENVGDHLVTHVTFDICNIELVVSPKLENYPGLRSENAAGCDIASEYRVLEPQEIDAPKSDNEAYNCQEHISLSAYLKVYGLKAYLVESAESHKYQIVVLSPMTTRLQYTRKDHHSYDSKIVALSATFCCVATGFTMLVFLDEWYTLTKVFSGVFYESLAFAMYGSGDGPSYQELPSRESVYSDSRSGETVFSMGSHESLVTNTQFVVHSTCELQSFDLVLHNSRESYNLENYMNVMPIERETGRISATHDTSGLGIHISLQQLMTEFNIKGGDMDFIIDITGIRSIIFRYLAESERSFDKSELKNLLCALNFLAEAAVTQSRVCLCLRSCKDFPSIGINSTDDLSCSHVKTTHMLGDLPLEVNAEGLVDHWLSANICISGVYMVGWEVKDILVSEQRLEEISAEFSIGGAFQNISWRSKGGSLLLEAMAVALFIECCTSYCHCILELWSTGQSLEQVVSRQIKDMAAQDSHLGIKPQQVQLQETMWECVEVFSLFLSHLSLILVAWDEYGKLREVLFEVDFDLNLKLLNMVGKFSMGIPKFSMISRFIPGGMKHKAKVTQSSLFSSIVSEDSSCNFNGKDSSSWLWNKEAIQAGHADASGSSLSGSEKGFNIDSSMSSLRRKILRFSPQNSIVKDLKCFLAVEGPVTRDQTSHAFLNDIWVGNGSISGFDMTITLSEIKMILSAYESICKVSNRKRTTKVELEKEPKHREPEGSTEEIIPDGTIVAIQDTEQHMYIAVDGSENKYDIAGTIHYSLVGKRALFRVKYHKLRQWKSKAQYFSLISLYAKDHSGKSLQLNSNPRSRFVDISCSSDSESALWRMLSFEHDTYEDAVELEFSSPLAKGTFHLLNKKNDCAMAFTDGVLEFVSKPGNLFKWKVFTDPGPRNNMLPNISWDSSETSLDSKIIEMGESRTNRNLLGITITVDKVTLTIVHELSNTEEKFPLLQVSVTPNQTIIQISKSKLRVMNTSVIVLYCFDAQRNSWMDFVQPLEFYSFCCSKFHVQGSENMHGVPSHFYAKIKEVNFSVSELSLDILLFVIGELDIAGPYAVKKPVVSTSCGKIVNQSGVTLLCQFYDNEDVLISARQSATVFLRHLALANQPPEASFLSLQLRDQGFLSTSPIHLSLLETRKFAWRTRIISSQDSKSFPGPLTVVEISRGIEDGISIIVAPMLKIHNETDFPLELRFQRPQHKETDAASLMLKAGDVIDDSLTAFNAVDLSGGLRKALTSLGVGNFIFSFRPNIDDSLKNLNQSLVEWSDDLKGGKPVHLSGVFDKLTYKVRKAFSVDSGKSSLRSANCVIKSEGVVVANIHFLILTVGKGMPVMNPDNFGHPGNKESPVAMQEQKEIFVLPTIQVSNLLHTEIHVNLTDKDLQTSTDHGDTWSNATIPCGSTVNFYADPETIYFTVTLTSFDSRSKPVNSSDWVRKLQKQKDDIPHLDIELDFGGGKYFATLRLSRGHRGTLKVVILTTYALQNNSNALFFCFVSKQKSFSSEDLKRFGSSIPPELGSYLPPNSIISWFMKCSKLRLKLLEEKALDTQLDLDALSGLAEIDLEVEDISGLKTCMKLGVSLRPSTGKEALSQIVTLSSRYVVCNESEEIITVQQCYMEGMEELIAINSKQRIALRLKRVMKNKRETNAIENLLRKHAKSQDDISLFIQFRLNESGLSWSGPVCVASLGRFFLKFRKSSEYPENHLSDENNLSQFAVVHVVEEGSSIVLHFHRPPDTNLPYRIENRLRDAPITYYQKGSSAPEALGAGVSLSYVWDDLTLPHKLIIQLDDVHLLREINLDKVRSWKPFYRNKQTRGLGFHLPLEKKSEDHKQTTYSQQLHTETVKVGYEVYAEGVTRILRICDFSNSHKVNEPYGTRTKMRLRISYLAVHLLEHAKQDADISEPSNEAPIIIARFERINCDSMFTSRHNYNQIRVQSLSVDEKWVGAPFATMLRRHQSEKSDANDCILRVMIILLPSSSHVKQVKHLSIVLLPLTLNLDEETLMKIVPFWRSSLSDSSAPRQQYYFDHFEIHPIKIVASFLPGELYYSYSSTQDTLRSLLHSVIKMPAIQSKTVELNGVLVTHALITLRELTIKCAQHYSWYSMRAIYMAKGSPLLPPAFASIFDDLASSSLDVFFDPSSGLFNLPGMTLGTLKLISKFIDNKGFSGTKRYFGDMGKTLKTAGSNILFAAVTEVSDSVLKGAETSGFSGMVGGFHQGILKLAMEPTVLGNAFMEGGPNRKIKLDRSPGIDELYIEGYLQAMLDTMYKQEYLRVKVIDNLVILKNLPPSSALINEIMESVNGFLASKALLKGETTTAHSLRYMRGEREWRIGPTMLTLCEHLFVSFAIRFLRKQAGKCVGSIKLKEKTKEDEKAVVQSPGSGDKQKVKLVWKWGIGKFVLSGIVAYIDGRLCRNIPNPLARRIVSGFLLSFLDTSDDESR